MFQHPFPQKIYNAVLNLRIRLHSLLNLACTLPPLEHRQTSPPWQTPSVQTDISDLQSSLHSLSSLADDAFAKSHPSAQSNRTFAQWRLAVLDHWARHIAHSSGKLASTSFKTIDTTPSAHIKATLSSGTHLQKSRRATHPIQLVAAQTLESGSYNFHYNDTPLYRTLLSDIIQSSTLSMPLDHMPLRNRVRKKRTAALAKGRRIRYQVHDKLVAFLTPVPLPHPGPVDQILASLFGSRRLIKQ